MVDGEEAGSVRVYGPLTVLSVSLGVLAFVFQVLMTSSAVYNHKEYLLSTKAGSQLPRLISKKSGTSSSSGSNNSKRRNGSGESETNTMSSRHSSLDIPGGGTPESVSSNRRRQRLKIMKMRQRRERRMSKHRIQKEKSWVYVSLELSLFIFNTLATLIWGFLRSDWMAASNGAGGLSKRFCVGVLISQSLMFLLAKMSLHLILVYRLHFTFQRSSVEIKQRYLQYFAAGVISEILLAGVFQAWLISQEGTVGETNMAGMQVCTLSAIHGRDRRVFGMDDIISLMFSLIDAMIYILTIAMFVERMKKLRLDRTDQRITVVTRKITVLGSVNICLNLLVYCVLIPIDPRTLCLVPLCALFDSLSIYLIPKYSHRQYNFMCHYCDQCAISWTAFWKADNSGFLPPPTKLGMTLPSKSCDDTGSSKISRSELALHSKPNSRSRRGVGSKLAHRPRLSDFSLENNRTHSTESSSVETTTIGFTQNSGPIPNLTDTPSLGPIAEEMRMHMVAVPDHLTIVDPAYGSSSVSANGSADEMDLDGAPNEDDDEDDDLSEVSTESSCKPGTRLASVELETVNESRENTPNRESFQRRYLKERVSVS